MHLTGCTGESSGNTGRAALTPPRAPYADPVSKDPDALLEPSGQQLAHSAAPVSSGRGWEARGLGSSSAWNPPSQTGSLHTQPPKPHFLHLPNGDKLWACWEKCFFDTCHACGCLGTALTTYCFSCFQWSPCYFIKNTNCANVRGIKSKKTL